MRLRLILLAGALAAVSSCGEQKVSRAPCPTGKICLEYGNTSEPVSLDPHKIQGTWESHIVGDLMVGLMDADASGRPVPGIAERWDVSPDGKVWTFHLREAQWSDGVPVTADDFVFSFRRIMDPKTASEYASLLYFIKNAQPINESKLPTTAIGATALGPRTLRLELEHPAPYLPELLFHQTMQPVPKHVVEKLGDDWSKPQNYVSNGPYVLRAWRLGDRVNVAKNPRFYDAANVCVDEINYYPTVDAISAERRVMRGELDVNTEIQSNRIAYLRQPGQMPEKVRTHTYLGTGYVAFNNGVKALQDKRVRQALSMAIDREFIAFKLLRGGQQPAYTFVPPGVANYEPAPLPQWASWTLEQRHEEARRLLAAAGYGPSNPLRLEIKHRSSPDPRLIMPAIQADWKAIGVDVQLAMNETQIAYQSYRIRDFEVADAAWVADYNDAMSFLYLMHSSTGPHNYGDYNNPAYDALLMQADNEPDVAKRAALLRQAEVIMLDDASIAPHFFYINKNLVSERITGWVDNITDTHRSRYLCVKDRQQP